jgi:hypothetical protein
MFPAAEDLGVGHKDYFTGVVINGLNGTTLVPLAADAGGNLSALLKANYNGTPTTLKCDADGSINVTVAGNSGVVVVDPKPAGANFPVDIKTQTAALLIRPDATNPIFKTQEQSPLTEIKVKSSAGATNIPVDICAQTLSPIVVAPQGQDNQNIKAVYNIPAGGTCSPLLKTSAFTFSNLRVRVTVPNKVSFATDAIVIFINGSDVENHSLQNWGTHTTNSHAPGTYEFTIYDTTNGIFEFIWWGPNTFATSCELRYVHYTASDQVLESTLNFTFPQTIIADNLQIIAPSTQQVFQHEPGPWNAVRGGITRTQIAKASYASGSTTIVHTVTAGKTFYLVSFNATLSADASNDVFCRVRNTEDTTVYTFAFLTTYGAGVMVIAQSLPMPIACPAGYDIIISSAVRYGSLAIQGWEE